MPIMRLSGCVAIVALVGALASSAMAREAARRPRHAHGGVLVASGDHPLTIGARRRGVYRVGDAIIAPGGFSAHGFGYPQATPEERRQALNASIRARSTGLYRYGFEGTGGPGLADGPETGYANPYYGNAFNPYVGYGGLPTRLAFGPGFANRHITGHDPAEDDDAGPPSPADLGYRPEAPGE